MTIECTKLCILSATRQAYGCLWHYKFQHMIIAIIAALPFFIAGLTGYLDPVSAVASTTEKMPDGFNLSFAILVATTFLWAIPVIILWQRLYLLGPEHLIRKKVWPLMTRSLRLIYHSMIFFGLILIAAVAITWGLLYLRVISSSEKMIGTITQMGEVEYILYILAFVIILSFLLIIALRFSMAFSSLTIGKSLRLTTSWRMTRKNTFRMLLATFIGSLPVGSAVIILLWAANHYFHIDLLAGTAPNPDMVYIFVLLFSPMLTLPLAFLCALTSTFYRHCGCAEYREPTP